MKNYESKTKKSEFFVLARHAFVILAFLFLALYTQALSMGLYCWPVTMIVVGNLILSLDYTFYLKKGIFNKRHLSALAPFLITILIVIWGVAMRHDLQSEELASEWPTYVILALLILHIPVSSYLIYKLKGYRWYAVSLGLLQLWCSLSASFIAAMSVKGEWI